MVKKPKQTIVKIGELSMPNREKVKTFKIGDDELSVKRLFGYVILRVMAYIFLIIAFYSIVYSPEPSSFILAVGCSLFGVIFETAAEMVRRKNINIKNGVVKLQ